MDTRRWILVEAWLSLGLRVEWCPGYESQSIAKDDWIPDDESNVFYVYAGHRLWLVKPPIQTRPWNEPVTVPVFGIATLRHELAHFMAATKDEREKRNFGMSLEDRETHVTQAERVIDAMLLASARIADLALVRR